MPSFDAVLSVSRSKFGFSTYPNVSLKKSSLENLDRARSESERAERETELIHEEETRPPLRINYGLFRELNVKQEMKTSPRWV